MQARARKIEFKPPLAKAPKPSGRPKVAKPTLTELARAWIGIAIAPDDEGLTENTASR